MTAGWAPGVLAALVAHPCARHPCPVCVARRRRRRCVRATVIMSTRGVRRDGSVSHVVTYSRRFQSDRSPPSDWCRTCHSLVRRSLRADHPASRLRHRRSSASRRHFDHSPITPASVAFESRAARRSVSVRETFYTLSSPSGPISMPSASSGSHERPVTSAVQSAKTAMRISDVNAGRQ